MVNPPVTHWTLLHELTSELDALTLMFVAVTQLKFRHPNNDVCSGQAIGKLDTLTSMFVVVNSPQNWTDSRLAPPPPILHHCQLHNQEHRPVKITRYGIENTDFVNEQMKTILEVIIFFLGIQLSSSNLLEKTETKPNIETMISLSI